MTALTVQPVHDMPAIACLDHGFVRLVDSMGNDLSVVRAARVSYDAAWRTGENEANDDRLLRRLWWGGAAGPDKAPAHSTPFEAVTFTFEVKAPIFVFRQWHRHRAQSYNELSARYRELPDEFYVPELTDIGIQSTTNKQGREPGSRPPEIRAFQRNAYRAHCETAFELYHNLLASGWPKELARGVLPVSTYSHMFATMNLLNLFRFLTLRADTHAQYEIRVYAEAMIRLANEVVPKAMALWREGNGHA